MTLSDYMIFLEMFNPAFKDAIQCSVIISFKLGK